jgi:hypothetical protein
MRLKNFQNIFIVQLKNKAIKSGLLIKKYAIPTTFAALFYTVLFFFGNRTICVFKATYGVPCPGCGMTRSYIHFLSGDIEGALYYHPLFIMPIALALIWIFKDIGFISKIYKSRVFWISMAIVFIAVWAVRMLNMFPDIPPLDFNRYGLIPVIYDFIRHVFR